MGCHFLLQGIFLTQGSNQVICIVGRLFTIWATRETHDKPRQCIKKQRHHFTDKGPYNQSYGFSSSHVKKGELDHKEGWVLKNWYLQTVVLEKTLERPLGSKEIQPVHPKGYQHWTFIGRTDTEAEAPILWPPDMKSQLIRKHWCWERLREGGEGSKRGWDGWMASPTQRTQVWANSGR